MRHRVIIASFILGLLFFHNQGDAQNNYVLTIDSKTRDGVKYGEHITTQFKDSKIFPGTIRYVDVYVPAGYDGKSPACVCVFQDGMSYKADTVVSNLIESKELPMMILIAASPGWIPGDYDAESPRANRTYEYDTPSPRFGKFLLEELLPFAETLQTSDGRKIVLSNKREDRMITGCSSGAACAFNVAWNTNAFSRVYSSCGSFTGLRGSFTNATLVHKFETKPIRFFFQSGSHDMWTSFGDWWSANQAMVRSMEFAGYDFDYKFTENANHCDDNVTQIFPDVLRFLWKGYPDNIPSPKHKSHNGMINQILLEGKTFEKLSLLDVMGGKLVSNNGSLFVTSEKETWVLDEHGGKGESYLDKRILAFGNDGISLVYSTQKGLEILDKNGKTIKRISQKIYPHAAVALRDGRFYIVGALGRTDNPRMLWALSSEGALSLEDENLKGARSLGISANDNWLYVFEYDTRRGFNYMVQKDGSGLKYKQEFFYIHLPDEADGAEVSSSVTDNYGRTYLATAYGIQVCDYNGRSEAILPLPDNVKPISITWGGKDLNYLYILGDDNIVYRRQLNTRGASVNDLAPKIRVGAG